jgi:hypothetical protein
MLGRMSGPRAHVALALFAIVGCASSSEAPAAGDASLPDGSRYLVDLSDEEALALCEWESERLHYGDCLDDAIVGSANRSCTESLATCTAPDAVANAILACMAGARDEAGSCDRTVAERLTCDIDLKRHYDALPSCEQVTDQTIRDVLYGVFPPSCDALRCP